MKISNEIEVRRCHHVIVIAVFVIVIIPLLLLIIIIIIVGIIIIIVVVVTIIRIIKLSDINIFINHPFGWLASQSFGAREATEYV